MGGGESGRVGCGGGESGRVGCGGVERVGGGWREWEGRVGGGEWEGREGEE